MNKTTKADRERWIARALALIKMNSDTGIANADEVTAALVKEFGISRDSARTAMVRAAMRIRHVLATMK